MHGQQNLKNQGLIKFAVVRDAKLCVHYLLLQPAASIFRAENGGNSFLREDELRLQ